jgi:hypothetical protein
VPQNTSLKNAKDFLSALQKPPAEKPASLDNIASQKWEKAAKMASLASKAGVVIPDAPKPMPVIRDSSDDDAKDWGSDSSVDEESKRKETQSTVVSALQSSVLARKQSSNSSSTLSSLKEAPPLGLSKSGPAAVKPSSASVQSAATLSASTGNKWKAATEFAKLSAKYGVISASGSPGNDSIATSSSKDWGDTESSGISSEEESPKPVPKAVVYNPRSTGWESSEDEKSTPKSKAPAAVATKSAALKTKSANTSDIVEEVSMNSSPVASYAASSPEKDWGDDDSSIGSDIGLMQVPATRVVDEVDDDDGRPGSTLFSSTKTVIHTPSAAAKPTSVVNQSSGLASKPITTVPPLASVATVSQGQWASKPTIVRSPASSPSTAPMEEEDVDVHDITEDIGFTDRSSAVNSTALSARNGGGLSINESVRDADADDPYGDDDFESFASASVASPSNRRASVDSVASSQIARAARKSRPASPAFNVTSVPSSNQATAQKQQNQRQPSVEHAAVKKAAVSHSAPDGAAQSSRRWEDFMEKMVDMMQQVLENPSGSQKRPSSADPQTLAGMALQLPMVLATRDIFEDELNVIRHELQMMKQLYTESMLSEVAKYRRSQHLRGSSRSSPTLADNVDMPLTDDSRATASDESGISHEKSQARRQRRKSEKERSRKHRAVDDYDRYDPRYIQSQSDPYTSYSETVRYIRRHRPRVPTWEEAVREVERECPELKDVRI